MRAPAVRPTGVERVLDPDELIVSKTDPKGLLTYVNPVFCRMAAATEDQLLGLPHKVIRHPDMPRAVFKLLWDTLAARREIFAYVKNLGLDGTHYWVFAHVTPSLGAGSSVIGFHSNRRAPSRQALAAVEPLYRELRRIEETTSGAREGLTASSAALAERLGQRGMTYDEFVWSVTP